MTAQIDEQVFILKPEAVQIADTVRIDRWTRIEGGLGVTIGECVHISSFCHINGGGGRVELRDHCGLASGVKVIGGQPDLSFAAICPQEPDGTHGVLRYTTVIGSYALLATNAVILPGVSIGDGAIVGAGAVVTHDVPPWTIVAGVPARPIGRRDQARAEWQALRERSDSLEVSA